MNKKNLILVVLSLLLVGCGSSASSVESSSVEELSVKYGDAYYYVTFVTNGGSEIAPYTTNVITTEPETTKEGFDFAGWHLLADLSDEVVTFPFELEKDTTFYAAWLPIESKLRGAFLSYARVDAMEAKSYWSFDYEENGLSVVACVTDEIIFTANTTGYNDNVEIAVAATPSTNPAGYNTNEAIKVLCDAAGNSYMNIFTTSNAMSANSPLQDGIMASAVERALILDGYDGYEVSFYIPYSAIGTTYEAALGNLSFAVAMRNSNSPSATSWGNMIEADFLNAWSYYILREDGTFGINENIDVDYLFVGDSYYSLTNWFSANTDLDGKNSYVIANVDWYLEDWLEYVSIVTKHKPKNVIFNIGGKDITLWKTSIEEMKDEYIAFLDEIHSLLPDTNIYVVSVNPIKNYPGRTTSIITFNNYLSAYSADKTWCNFINTLPLFINDDNSIKTNLYKNNYNLNAAGYTLYIDYVFNVVYQ
ncbi:MAG: hypothetical protein BWX74_00464 [Tenericutes bacterium ADurb.Bin087]|nr:MAG: hypothetical protein BWX74_00464 [Tenericutes bacterium ADurb.Bin087]